MQPSLTIAAVTGHDSYTQSSVYAIERSYRQLRGRIAGLRCLLVSPSRPDYLPDFIRHVPVKPFGYLEYNLFILYSLAQLVDTDFCLTVQNDGFVLDGSNWRDEFFDYDFIGAPLVHTEVGLINGQLRQQIAQGKPVLPVADNEIVVRPQNGGFALRSKRLLDAPRRLNLRVQIMPPKMLSGSPVKLAWDMYLHHEDMFLTAAHRGLLSQHGIRFAPDHIAAAFACEDFWGNTKFGMQMDQVLGCHTVGTFAMQDDRRLVLKMPVCETLDQVFSLPLVQRWLALGFDVELPEHLLGCP